MTIDQPPKLRGRCGVLATCDSGKEPAATIELKRLLSERLEQQQARDGDQATATAAAIDATADVGLSAADMLRREVESLQAEDKASKVAYGTTTDPVALDSVITKCKGLVMLRVGNEAHAAAGAIDMVRAVCEVLHQVEGSGEPCSRHLVRLVPLQRTCFAGLEEIKEQLPALLEPHFGPGTPPLAYKIAVKRRNNPTFDKDGLITHIASTIDRRHKVQFKQAEAVIVVEIFQSFCGMSVVRGGDYDTFAELNLRKTQDRVRKKRKADREQTAVAVAVEAGTHTDKKRKMEGGAGAAAAAAEETRGA